MNIKIYLSSKLIEKCTFCELYGLVEDLRDEIRFTVLDAEPLPNYTEPIGKICSVTDYMQFRTAQNDRTLREQLAREDNFLRLAISNSGRIKHVMAKVKGVTIESLNKLLIIYDEKGFSNLAENDLNAEDCDNDLLHLARLIKASKAESAGWTDKLHALAEREEIQRLYGMLLPVGKGLGMLFRKTALYYHFNEWVECIRQKDANALRFAIYCLSYTLMKIRRTILRFPFDAMVRWVRGVYTNLESLEIYNIGSIAKENVTITYVAPRSATFWFRDTATDFPRWEPKRQNSTTIGEFLVSLVKGELVSFIQPDERIVPRTN
uniref:Uncharacterized protein n=1 Tax=Anopheles stephensi TaxID=30069 RepID=A0A182Y4J7_ANOST